MYTSNGGGFFAGLTASLGFFTRNDACSLAGNSDFSNLLLGPVSVNIGYSGGQFSSFQIGIVVGTPDIFFAGAVAGASRTTLYPLLSF